VTDEKRFTEVDAWIESSILGTDDALAAALAASAAAGLPAIQVAPNQGKLLALLAESVSARSILEVGTLGGYSTIWLARALAPGGRLITLELEPKHADVARANLAHAGLADRTEVRVGRAIELLPALPGPFDFVFIDADKPSNADYFAAALERARSGAVIVVDNVIRRGAVIDAAAITSDANVIGVRRLFELVASEERRGRVRATAVQTVGSKGWDGLLVARVV
jgi:predicted O-methyltransferase YrrM